MYACSNIIFILLENTTIDSNDHDIMDIYDKGEEMMPTINIEDEEVSEDGIVLESEYERMMMEFNESDEDEGETKMIEKKQAKRVQARMKSSIYDLQ